VTSSLAKEYRSGFAATYNLLCQCMVQVDGMRHNPYRVVLIGSVLGEIINSVEPGRHVDPIRESEIPLKHSVGSFSVRQIRWLALLLSLPALIPLGNALIAPLRIGKIPTGFIQYDMPYYMANGREHFDQGFQLTYGNPYAGYNTPAIYFQPHIFLLGLMQQLGLDPAVTFNCFGLLALFFAAIVAVRFYAEVVGTETTSKRIGLVCFFWGGGILTLAGLTAGLVRGHPLSSIWRYDSEGGWWMLNFGRNLVYPTEAYYHGVFLLSLLLLMRRRFGLSLACAALLCCSHPFSGLTLICVLIAYSGVELAIQSGVVNLRFMLAAILIAVLHVSYYLIWLNRFSDHRTLQTQWQIAWLYPPRTFIFALLIVGCLAIWRLARSSFQCFRDPRVRLFAVWFLVVFGLTQNNLFLARPFQPIHFAHGYDWMALFFIGASPLIASLDRLLIILTPWVRRGALTLLLGVFLLDNFAWLAKNAVHDSAALTLTTTQSATLHWLRQNLKSGDMVICQDSLISYLVSTYTPARSWQGHIFNTPSIGRRNNEVERLFREGHVLPEWNKQGVFYVSPVVWLPPTELSLERRYGNSEFVVWSSQER
jgi:hypothetical protein